MNDAMQAQKARASAWFYNLRDEIRAAFEHLEDAPQSGPLADRAPGRFDIIPTRRASPDGADGGGGEMAIMKGRLFEKVGVNVSQVHGELAPRAQAAMAARGVPGMDKDPRFWASGISLVAHMRSPKVPAVHMNTRMFWTPGAWWFGGGSDLNPALEIPEDSAHFHGALERACAAHNADYYPRFKKWADEYFYIPHRKRARGVGGIFYDDLNSGDWEADFAFTQEVGRAFLKAYLPLVERRMHESWTEEDRRAQLAHRGLYAEFNLCYDRGTKFGLESGHNIDAVLMSLPPLAAWE